VNLALSELPDFICLPGNGPHLRGAVSISPSLDYLERAYDDAKYGEFSKHPYMDIVIPSMIDPGMAPPGRHVMSCFVQYAPYNQNGGWTDANREAFGDAVVNTLARYAPNIRRAIIGRQVLVPSDIERTTGPHRRAISSRASWRCISSSSSGRCRLGQLPHPHQRLLAVRRRHPSRRRHHGRLGSPGRSRDPEGRGTVSAAQEIVVIGGGINGLVAAACLAKAGHKVLLLERQPRHRRPEPDRRVPSPASAPILWGRMRAGCLRRWPASWA
jgi:hypothetical protein